MQAAAGETADTINNSAVREISLFGGAIAASLPGNMRDISDFVPVPDNQEIY